MLGRQLILLIFQKRSYNICSKILEKKLIEAKKVNKLPKVVIAVHFAGQSCNMKRLKELADEYGFFLIEDACHAIGGKYEGKPIGDCRYSDAVVFSFHPVKVITTGEGGAVLTNNENLHKKIQALRTHGIVKNRDCLQKKK